MCEKLASWISGEKLMRPSKVPVLVTFLLSDTKYLSVT